MTKPSNINLPPKGSETWSIVSPDQPQTIKRIIQFARNSITNTIHISNLGDTELRLTIDLEEISLYPRIQGSYITSIECGRKIWANLVAAGYTPV